MVEEIKYENLTLKKGVTKEELDSHNHAYTMLFREYSKTDLANEARSYKTLADKSAPEYPILCNEIESRSKKSIEDFVNQNRMTKTDEKSFEFYNKFNSDGVFPGSVDIRYARNNIREIFGYEKLKVKSKKMVNVEGFNMVNPDGTEAKMKISQDLENIQAGHIRSAAISMYNHGEKVWNRVHGKK